MVTDPRLAKLRRTHGGTWLVTFVIEGYDEEFQMHVGLQYSRRFAIAVVRFRASIQYQCKTSHIHIQSIVEA